MPDGRCCPLDPVDRRDLLRFGARADNLTDPPVAVGVRAAG
jgi:hypothetical protein